MITGRKLLGRAKAVTKLVEGLDPAWDEIIDECLEEDPDDRPSTIADTLDSLYEVTKWQKEI